MTNRINFFEKNTQIICRFFCRCNANLISILKALYLPILHTVTMSHIGGSCWLIGGYRWSSVVIFDEFDCFLVWDDLAPWKFGIGQYGNRTIWHQDNLAPGQFGTIMWKLMIEYKSVSVRFYKTKCYVMLCWENVIFRSIWSKHPLAHQGIQDICHLFSTDKMLG